MGTIGHSRSSLLPTLLGLVLAVLVLIPGRASAHARLVLATPAAGSFQTAAPTEVRLTFDSEIRHAGSTVLVIAPGGADVNNGPVTIGTDRMSLVVALQPGLADGLYTVSWIAISALDGDEEEGTFDFGLRVGAQLPTLQVDPTTVAPGQQFRLSGTGFRPNGTVVVSLGTPEQFLDAARADASGRLAITVTVPSDAATGLLRFTAADGDGATARAEAQNGMVSPGACRLAARGLFGCP